MKLLQYQIDCLKDKSKFKSLMWARGTRKTFTITLEAVNDCYRTEARGKQVTWVILSRGERQSKEAIREAIKHCRMVELVKGIGIEYAESIFKVDKKRYTQHTIYFPGGSRIIGLPANPDTARGYTANLVLDEFSAQRDSQEIWRATMPVRRGKYRVIVASTPKGGRATKFWEIMHDDSGVWSKHVVDIHEAVRQGLPFNIEEERLALGDPEGWSQEFELQWIDEQSNWLSYELICGCESEEAIAARYRQGNPCYVGIDIGRKSHLWVAWVLERVAPGQLVTREVVTRRGATFAEHDAIVRQLMRRYKIVKVFADETGIGQKPIEDWQREYGNKVEGITFNASNKYEMAIVGKRMMEESEVLIPEEREIREDLHRLKRYDSIGIPRIDAPENAQGHADRAWAFFLACWAAKQNPPVTSRKASGIIVPIDN